MCATRRTGRCWESRCGTPSVTGTARTRSLSHRSERGGVLGGHREAQPRRRVNHGKQLVSAGRAPGLGRRRRGRPPAPGRPRSRRPLAATWPSPVPGARPLPAQRQLLRAAFLRYHPAGTHRGLGSHRHVTPADVAVVTGLTPPPGLGAEDSAWPTCAPPVKVREYRPRRMPRTWHPQSTARTSPLPAVAWSVLKFYAKYS